MATVDVLTTQLKTNMEALEKLRLRRKEIKTALNRDGLQESEEVPLAEELLAVSKAIKKLEEDRRKIYEALPASTRD